MPLPISDPRHGVSAAVNRLALMVAACTGFQQLAPAVADADAALANRVYTRLLPRPKNKRTFTKEEWVGLRPFAFVALDQETGYDARRVAFNCFDDSGALVLNIQQNAENLLLDGETLDTVGDDELGLRWENAVGSIISRVDTDPEGFVSLTDLAHQSDYFAADDFRKLIFFRNTELEIATKGDFFVAQMTVTWGNR